MVVMVPAFFSKYRSRMRSQNENKFPSLAACIYEGCKHSLATDAIARGVQERHLRAFLGHADVRSTRRYARLADTGLLEVLPAAARRARAERLSRGCPTQDERPGNLLDSEGRMVEAAGIEPASA